MNDNQLLRYSRHILLPKIGYEGQEKLVNSHALIVGAGGLGSPVALYLAASGVGKLTICDFDTVDLTNLQRQIIHTTKSVGVNKAVSAQQTIHTINPDIVVQTIQQKSTEAEFEQLAKDADVVIDCSDNFATRYTLNRVCLKLKKTLVSGAAIGFEGQITVFDFRDFDPKNVDLNASNLANSDLKNADSNNKASPCYHCLYPDVGNDAEMRCAENGVFAPLVGMIGTTQAAEALKLIMHLGESLQGRLLLLDVLSMEWRTIKLSRDPACTVCSQY